MSKALAGVRVVELGWAAAGPLVGKYLANFGAEVIHVESATAPDVFRTTYPPFKDNLLGEDRAAMFAFYNDGKRGVTLDLKHPRAKDVALRLARAADVWIESFPAGTLARRGLGADVLRAANPRLVVLSSCNQGQTGPHAQHPGYGSQLTALAGFNELLGERDRTPVILYGPYIDYIAVGYGVIAILAALERRRRTGEGCVIDLSQYEAGLQFLAPAILEHAASGTVPTRDGNRDRVAVPHGVYPCASFVRPGPASPAVPSVRPARASPPSGEPPSGEPPSADRWIALSVWDDAEWGRLAALIGVADERFATADGRRAHEGDIDRRIAAWTGARERDEAVRSLRSSGVHAAPVETIRELADDPQLAHRGFWQRVPHPVLGTITAMSAPFTLSATPGLPERGGPLLGEHNESVYRGLLGMAEEEYAALAADGVFR